jgi:hypothetical protein
MATERGRLVRNNETVLDQADFFGSGGYTRVTGLTTTTVGCVLFFNNVAMPWTLVTGAGVSDGQVAAGKVYWVEIPGSPGYYNVRFRPNAVGYWRLLLSYPEGTQTVAHDFDVMSIPTNSDQGLVTSFIKPGS